MGNRLTGRQKQIYEYIRRKISERGYPPSVREIGEAVGLRSSSTVHGHLARLERKGFLRRDPTKPRAIELLHAGERTVAVPSPDLEAGALSERVLQVPVLGRVTAGQPLLAMENIEETHLLPREWAGGGETFMLRVRGDSMQGAGILDDDLVIVRRQETAENGEIVVALLEDEATVKRYYREPSQIRLQPENPRMSPIYTRDVKILGRVIGLFRNYERNHETSPRRL